MIVSAKTGSSFSSLAAYLGGEGDRVGWTEGRNVFADDVDGIVAEMREQAALSARTEKPVYHLKLAFDPSDEPTDAELRAAVDRTLRDVGLGDHQALVVRHVDRDHAHVHVVVNRVDPDGRAWSTSHDRQRLRASIETQERELGVRWTGRNAHEAGVGRGETDRGFAREVRRDALADFREAGSWRELRERLGARGLQVEVRTPARGAGDRRAVITDGRREAALTSVSRTVGLDRLEGRLGPAGGERRRSGRVPAREGQPEATRAGHGRRYAKREAAAGRPGPAAGIRARTASRLGRGAYAAARTTLSDDRRDADEALARGAVGAASQAAGRALESNPLTPARRFSQETTAEPDPPRAAMSEPRDSHAGRTLAERGRVLDGRTESRLDRFERAVEHQRLSDRLAAERARALGAAARVEERAASAVHRARQANGRADGAVAAARRAFGTAMTATYARPDEAARAFLADSSRDGAERAAAVLRQTPEHYGPLRATPGGTRFGLGRPDTTDPARVAARLAADKGRDYADAARQAARVSTEVGRVERARGGLGPEAQAAHGVGPAAVKVRLDRLDRAIQKRATRAGEFARTLRPLGPPDALKSRVGSVGLAAARAAVKAASRDLGRGE